MYSSFWHTCSMLVLEYFVIIVVVFRASAEAQSDQASLSNPQRLYGVPGREPGKPLGYSASESQNVPQNRRIPITGDNESNLRIAAKLCAPGLTDSTIKAFFKCYYDVEGTNIYWNCQHEVLGCTLTSTKTISATCQNLQTLQPKYKVCFENGLRRAGLDVDRTALVLNICMADALGVE